LVRKKIESITHDLSRFESIFYSLSNVLNKEFIKKNEEDDEKYKNRDEFEVQIYKDDIKKNYEEKYLEELNILLEDRSVIRVEEGCYKEESGEFRFTLNGIETALSLESPDITGINVFKKHFVLNGKNLLKERKTECGSFNFGFYIFDFTPQAPIKYQLDKEDKETIRSHRIYLYRDGIRVYPYGEPDDDWLRIDMYRGTISAGDFLSNDQVVGYVSISQKSNPQLQDKTNREGLIEQGNATDDFLALLRVFLAYIRQKPYARYRADIENKKAQDIFKAEQIQQDIQELKEVAKENRQVHDLVNRLEKEYKAERKYLMQRAETTEELAGVGLSVETASHDIIAIMGKAMGILDDIIRETLYDDELDKEQLNKELHSLRGALSFVEAQLKDIQLLFKSSKQKRKQIKVKEIIEKIERIYKRILQKEKIDLVINQIGSPLIAKTTDAVLLQLFLNLFDNSVYWLQLVSRQDRRIEITLDGNKGQLIFSDNGPGINKEDAPYIFQPFYSGRGLGLYIARQLLERNDYSIDLADLKSEKILSGANFVISFVTEEK